MSPPNGWDGIEMLYGAGIEPHRVPPADELRWLKPKLKRVSSYDSMVRLAFFIQTLDHSIEPQ